MKWSDVFCNFWCALAILMITFSFSFVLGADVGEKSRERDCLAIGAFRIGDVVYTCEKRK